jgi:putative toxin-antitoxin system antitoxin component (TIGR02293 family)
LKNEVMMDAASVGKEQRRATTQKSAPGAARAVRRANVADRGIEPLGAIYSLSPVELVEIIRNGVPAERLIRIGNRMQMPMERLFHTLKLPRSTMNRKIRRQERLSPEHSERVVGLERLVGQVQAMIEGTDAADDFDAGSWVGEWLERPIPALGGAKPAELMDTIQGQELVSRLLAQSQSGAYA